ncbi:phage portal protein [Streptomyces coelicoflavus]|uniref:Phage portal protein n=1 Tax=Streptomyces coelicoflavus TaxID=285562 RepID=A0A6N9V123_9ACTN|nr:phage portal protein [Streptomyces coelicoflavus]NEB22130.1 phage portal protein [Streptomyces coelicoflavus]
MVSTKLLQKALKELEDAKPAYVEADRFYTGTFVEPFQSVIMQRLLMRKEVNYKAVLSAVPVDAVVEKLEIVDIQTTDEDATDELQNFWKANQLQFVHKSAILAAEKFGDAYIFMWPEYDESQDSIEPDVLTGISASYQSPLKVRVFYDDMNPARKTHAVKRLKTGRGKQERAWLYLRDGTIEMYETPENKCGIEDFRYVEDVDNPLDEIPFIHLRNDLPYGRPLHEKAYGPQNQITKFLVNEVSGSDFNAFPQRYALAKTKGTSGGDDIDWSGQDDTVPDQDENQVSKLVSGPGRIWDLSGFDSVGQFNSADVDQYLKPIEKAVELMAVATGTPAYYFSADSVGGGTPSGESIRQRDARLNTKASWHQQHLDAGFEEMLHMAAELLLVDSDDLSISIKWKPIEYVSETEKLELIGRKIELGIPIAVAFAEGGYDEETVTEWMSGKPNDIELGRRVALLNTLGDAMQKLGTASALGLDMANVNELVTGVIADIGGLREQQDDEPAV